MSGSKSFYVSTTIFFLWLLPSAYSNSRREVVNGHHGAVAADDGRCSRIGMVILGEGGHAVDAAVATALCLGVVNPASSGIGGGDFMVLRLANGNAQAFDMRETAPIKSSENMYAGNSAEKASGILSVAVPGELAGLHEAWKQHGRLPWKRLVRPSERLARKGFKISRYLYMQMMRVESAILADDGLRRIFTSNGKNILRPGDVCRNKKLAETLRMISRKGVDVFYNGSIGAKLIEDITRLGGILTMKDLQGYQVKTREPISVETLGHKIITMPPPSGGPVMVLILNILARFRLPFGINGSLGFHRMIEALKHAFAVRMNLGDPDFDNISEVASNMLSPKFAEKLKKTIYDNMTFAPSYYGDSWSQVSDQGTSHLSIVDRGRNAVSLTATINGYFGAKILSPSTGIVLNNEMDDFSMPLNNSENLPPPGPSNFVKPGKRPLSSMTPTIVLKDEKLRAVVGASGGAMIIAGTTQVILNHLVKKMDQFSSVLAPRGYHQLIPNIVAYENWTVVSGDHIELPANIRADLQKKGHVLQSLEGGTIVQLISVASGRKGKLGKLVAVSDPRKGGFPAAY